MKTMGCMSREKLCVAAIILIIILSVMLASCSHSGDTNQETDGHLILNCAFDCLKTGESRKYYVKKSPASANYQLIWESGDENVATVDGEGNVTAVAGGKTQITVRAEGKPYKARMELTVADETVQKEDGENALQLAVNKVKNGGYVLITGGNYDYLSVDKELTVTCEGDVTIGNIDIKDDASLYLFSASVYAVSKGENKACVTIGENASFTAVGCSFLFDDPTGENRSESALNAVKDVRELYCRACSFYGYNECITIGATNGNIYLVNNDFSDAETAVKIDLRTEEAETDANPSGKVADNVYIGCKSCVELYYNSLTYTGKLEIPDSDVSVPS